jgi:regulator of protease activity HflC (stomatin/prohibitin superfamily)
MPRPYATIYIDSNMNITATSEATSLEISKLPASNNRASTKQFPRIWNLANVSVAATTLLALYKLARCSLKVVRNNEIALVERFGKFHSLRRPGIHVLNPLTDAATMLTTGEENIKLPEQVILSKDKVQLTVAAHIAYKINDSYLAQYNVVNYKEALKSLALVNLQCLVNRNEYPQLTEYHANFNTELTNQLSSQVKQYGIEIERFYMETIIPASSMLKAMQNIATIQQEKLAAIETAAKLEIQAECQKRIRIKAAEAEAKAIELKGQAEVNVSKLKLNLPGNELISFSSSKSNNDNDRNHGFVVVDNNSAMDILSGFSKQAAAKNENNTTQLKSNHSSSDAEGGVTLP